MDSVTFRLKSYSSLSIFPNSLPCKTNKKTKQNRKKKNKKWKQNPTFCPNHTFSRGGGLSWWLNQGWGRGDCGSGSRRLQRAARFKSKGGERVRSNKHQSKCVIPPNWKITVDYTAQIIPKEIQRAHFSILSTIICSCIIIGWAKREMGSYTNDVQNQLPITQLIRRISNKL